MQPKILAAPICLTASEKQHLLIKLLPCDFTIIYKAGSENRGTDALIRHPQHAELLSLVVPFSSDFLEELQEALQKDPCTKDILTAFLEIQPSI